MSPQDFIDQLLPGALACQKAHGIPASFTLADAALETGWGNHVRGNNLYGIKADAGWHGPVIEFPTREVIKGVTVRMVDRFRQYASWSESVEDHAKFLVVNPRYAACFHEKTGEGWARTVAAAGYATDPDYADKLISVIHGHKLSRFDGVSVNS